MKKKKYKKEKRKGAFVITGEFQATDREFGFVHSEELPEDIFIPRKKVNDALHGDMVECEVLPFKPADGMKREGRVLKVLERNLKRVVGTYEESGSVGIVFPDNLKFQEPIFIRKEYKNGAVTGHKVVVEITKYPDRKTRAEGKIKEILGHIDDPGVDILSIVEDFGVPVQFPSDVNKQIKGIPDEVLPEEIAGRLDLRNLDMVTIDGEDSKDLDDAVSVRRIDGLYELGVHIADVSHYVPMNTPLDKEALNRGTSVYLCDRVIPMLPKKLSNRICSLNEGVDRLALSCIMRIDGEGKIVNHKIRESVICVNRRMTYHVVSDILEKDDKERKREYQELCPMFFMMKELSALLRKNRSERGAIDFDLPESVIQLNADGQPISIEPYERNIASFIIEDFMIAANETVAEHFYKREIPFLYRIHEAPKPDKILGLEPFVNQFGYTLRHVKGKVKPKEIQRLLKDVSGTPEEALISKVTLRSMSQAKYFPECSGHFGLASTYYCHFTSPIRRYPDLLIHRLIKEELKGGIRDKRKEKYRTLLPDIAVSTSHAERRAVETERETDKLKKCQYMKNHIGEEFEGVISGLTSFGVFVELPNTVEGMIRVSSLYGEPYIYDEKNYVLLSLRNKTVFHLGDAIKVKMDYADEFLRTIDFVLPEEFWSEKGRKNGKK